MIIDDISSVKSFNSDSDDINRYRLRIGQLEKELSEYKTYYENMFNNNSQPMWIYEIETLKILDVNDAAVQHYGYSRTEFLSMTIMDIRPTEDIDTLLDDVLKIQKTYNNAGIWRHLKKNGEIIYVEIISHALSFNSLNARHVRALDVTQRLKIENEILDNEEINKLFIEYVPASLAMFDLEMNYITCSRRWLSSFSIKEESLKGRNHYEVFPEISEEWRKIHQRGQNGEVISREKEKFVRADGNVMYTKWEVRPWKYSNGEIGGIIIFTEDITEQTKLIEETIEAKNKAIKSDKLKSEFLANISHEMRTPLNGILGFSELLTDDDLTAEEKSEYIRIINESGAKMLKTIDNIVKISLIDSGLLQLNKTSFNVNNLLNTICKAFKIDAAVKNLSFKCHSEISNADAEIFADFEKLSAVIYNIAENAIKFTEEGEVTVLGRLEDNVLEFSITDTGIGIPPETQKHLFVKFSQGGEDLYKNFEGSGIGLYMSKSYVDIMNGNISFSSTPGKGSTFKITIPLNG